MAGNVRFHNKFHSTNHFTNTVPGDADSGSDPIASPSKPFQGDFYVAGSISARNVYASTYAISVLSAGSVQSSIKAVSGNYTVQDGDRTLLIWGGTTILPPASSSSNKDFYLKSISPLSSVTVSAFKTDVIDNNYSSIVLTSIGNTLHVIAYNSTWWILTPY